MIHLLHGFIGSGKTTLALELERETGALRLSPDEWMRDLCGDDPPAQDFPRLLAALLGRLRTVWVHAARNGGDVILDYGFWTRAEREAMIADLETLGLSWQWVVLPTSLEECRRRNARRNADGTRALNITDATFDLLATRFEPMRPMRAEADQSSPAVSGKPNIALKFWRA